MSNKSDMIRKLMFLPLIYGNICDKLALICPNNMIIPGTTAQLICTIKKETYVLPEAIIAAEAYQDMNKNMAMMREIGLFTNLECMKIISSILDRNIVGSKYCNPDV